MPSEAQLCRVHFQHLSAETVGLQVASQTVILSSQCIVLVHKRLMRSPEGRTGKQAHQLDELAYLAEKKHIYTCLVLRLD